MRDEGWKDRRISGLISWTQYDNHTNLKQNKNYIIVGHSQIGQNIRKSDSVVRTEENVLNVRTIDLFPRW